MVTIIKLDGFWDLGKFLVVNFAVGWFTIMILFSFWETIGSKWISPQDHKLSLSNPDSPRYTLSNLSNNCEAYKILEHQLLTPSLQWQL